jgi:hypothetical protein
MDIKKIAMTFALTWAAIAIGKRLPVVKDWI